MIGGQLTLLRRQLFSKTYSSNLKFLSTAFRENMRCVCVGGGGLDIFTLRCCEGEGLFLLRSLWISKTVLKLLIRSFPIVKSEDIRRLAKLTTLGLRAMGVGGHPKRHNFGPFNCLEQNCNLKILIGYVRGNGGRGRGVSCPPMIFDY